MKIPNFVSDWATSTALEVDVADLCNLQPEIQESPGAKAEIVYYGSPGTGVFGGGGTGPIRGAIDVGSLTFFVSGNQVYQSSVGGTVLFNTGSAPTIANDGAPVRMAASATQLIIVSGGIVYVISDFIVTDVDLVADPPWTFAIDCAYMDGFFIVLDDNGLSAGGDFFISTDPTTWDSLDFSNSPASANKLEGLAVDHEELWVFGTEVTQVFVNNGNADFPFVPNPSGVIQQGCLTRFSIQQLDNTLFWMGRNKDGYSQAFVAEGYSPRVVSIRPLERLWQHAFSSADRFITSWSYQMDGHTIWHLNFGNLNKSFRYDRSTNLWHRVAYRNPETGEEEMHIGSCHVLLFGTLHVVGDRRNGNMWHFSPTIYVDEYQAESPDDPGVPLVSRRRAPVIFSENKGIFFKLFELITTPGIGNGTVDTPETNPAWIFRYSKDNGHNWSNQTLLSLGPQGAYSTRQRKIGLGWGRAFVLEVSFSANLPRCIVGAEMEIQIGTS